VSEVSIVPAVQPDWDAVQLEPMMQALCSYLRAYEARLNALGSELLGVLPGLPSLGSFAGDGPLWLREILMPQVVPAGAFLRTGNRLGVLPPTMLRRVLAVRGLYAMRSAVRRCIDRAKLEQLREAIGEASLVALRQSAVTDGETMQALPESLDAKALVAAGLEIMQHDGSIDIPGVWHLIVLQIVGTPTTVPLHATEPNAETLRFLSSVTALIPELTW